MLNRVRFDRGLVAICVALAVAVMTETHNRTHAEESLLTTIGPRIGFSTTKAPLLGLTVAPFTHGYAGLRLQHLSDAGFYGSDALGVDMYLLEIGYKF